MLETAKKEMENDPVFDSSTPLDDVKDLLNNSKSLTIDCGVTKMTGPRLNDLMKTARAGGVDDFTLLNVCGQNLIGTGVSGPAKIDVHGLMGNHSAAFIDKIELNTYPTFFPNQVWCPGDAQVAIANTSNPTDLNIGGSVDDLFASYCPSGTFRVAGQGGNRCGLRTGAGIPHVWREIDYSEFKNMTGDQIKEDLLYKYQLRKAKLNSLGFQKFLLEFKKKIEDRKPPVIVFGRRVRDYFMEYAQGTIGVILNIYDAPSPVGYYICSGMTAGRAFIRGDVSHDRLGSNVKFSSMTDENREFLDKQIRDFYETFDKRLTDSYQEKLDGFVKQLDKNRDGTLDQFVKIVPIDSK
ncbi:MAG TPA: hypothetical protein ENI77_05980 [Nitrospirae bacterium]|nr:hypothetical protein [Nitrospirota bacterium]